MAIIFTIHDSKIAVLSESVSSQSPSVAEALRCGVERTPYVRTFHTNTVADVPFEVVQNAPR